MIFPHGDEFYFLESPGGVVVTRTDMLKIPAMISDAERLEGHLTSQYIYIYGIGTNNVFTYIYIYL